MLPIQRQCDVENLSDFARYYQSSWVGWHSDKEDKIVPCFVGSMLDHERIQLRALSKLETGQFHIDTGFSATWEGLKTQLDFGVPDLGMVQDGPTVWFCSYSTPRVPKKGYRSRDTQNTDFNSWDIRRKYVSRNGGDRYDWTWFVFNPEHYTLEQAEDKLNKGEVVGVPISRTLAVYSAPKFKNSLLAYKRWTVGHVVNPFLIHLKREYSDYEEDIARQTGAEVIVR